MIYECDYCQEQLGPHACSCPQRGQEFDRPVSSDAAAPPERSWPEKPIGAPQTAQSGLLQTSTQKTRARIFKRPPRVL